MENNFWDDNNKDNKQMSDEDVASVYDSILSCMSENKDPNAMFTDKEIEYIKEHSNNVLFDDIPLKVKLSLAHEYKKSFNVN